MNILIPARSILAGALLIFVGSPMLRADDALPPNLGRGLRSLVEWQNAQPAGRTAQQNRSALQAKVAGRHRVAGRQVDQAGNVVVDIRLTGAVAPGDVQKSLVALGATVTGEHVARMADKSDGILSAHLPLDQAVAAAKLPGVQSVLAAHRPQTREGEVPGQGVPVLHADEVQTAGYKGAGIVVGVISDSYDTVLPHAQGDVSTGDLPGTSNPDGYTSPVVVLHEDNDPDYDTDEGRAMLQIVHDVAPAAKLAFSTSGDTQSSFASNIRGLRTTSSCNCDIIVDDIGFSDEPFFSDSIVAEAVDDVVTSSTLAGKKVIYYSAAGNDGSASYSATFTPVSDAAARAGEAGSNNLQLSQVPASLTAAGFQNFKSADKGHGTSIVQKVTVSGDDAELDFQWDDPFVASKITADYNILVFDANGNYLNSTRDEQAESGTDNNFSTGEAIEYAELPLNSDGSDTVYQIAITCASTRSGSTPATRLRYFAYTDGSYYGKYIHTGQPTLFGHSGAANADGVAAYDVHAPTVPEYYNSLGPITIYFDQNGNRLGTPTVRNQPTIAAVDGVNTTFFPQPADENDSDNDGYPNFYGTSAAAPHAAAVAALLLSVSGPGSITSTHMRSLLQSTAASHDLDPGYSAVTLMSTDGTVSLTLSGNGDDTNNSAFDADFFRVTFAGPTGSTLQKLSVDIGPAGEVFDPTVDTGFPFKFGTTIDINKPLVTEALSTDAGGQALGELTLHFPTAAFPAGGRLDFGIDRDVASMNSGGNSADFLAGSKVVAKFSLADGSKLKLSGYLANKTGTGYSPDVGYGLINAEAALLSLKAGN